MLGFRLFDECGQDKGSIDSTASLSKAKLIRPKHALLLYYPGHGVSHPRTVRSLRMLEGTVMGRYWPMDKESPP